MRRRSLLGGLASAGAVLVAGAASAQGIDIWGLLNGRPPGSEYLRLEINKLLLNIRLAMMVGDKSEAKRLALQLPILSQRDPDWYKYGASFQITMVLVSLTDPRDRKTWVFANRGLMECFPGVGEGVFAENYRAVAKAGHDLLIADAAGPPLLSREDRGTAAALGLISSSMAPGPERVKWAQTARQEVLRNPEAGAAIKAWAVDKTTPRFVAAGIAVSGDWKAAATEYDKIISGSIGVMDPLLKERKNSTIGGLGAVIAGITTVEAEAATVYAMSGRIPQALELLERSRRNTGRARVEARAGAGGVTALQQEEKLLATGACVVQAVTSLVGAYALVSVRRKGKTQRFMAHSPDPGGVELMSRVVDSRSDHFLKDGLAPVYQRARRSRGTAAERKFKDYVARAAKDADALTGSTIRNALAKASVTPQDDVLVVLPANLALLPISLSRASDVATPLGMQYRLRYADSFASALNAAAVVRASREQNLAMLEPEAAVADLDYLGFERACVAGCFPGRLRKVEATVAPPVLAGLDGASHWHIASHASWDFKNPEKSGLAVGRKTTVTVADVQGLQLKTPPRLAFLSACETGLIDIDRRLDEFNGLLSAFLSCGAGGAIGSLWPVSDAATSLLTARFYDEHITNRRSPAEALQTTQKWLRDTPAGAFGDFVTAKVLAGKIAIEDAGNISGFLIDRKAEEAVFRDPYYWAGFQLYGA